MWFYIEFCKYFLFDLSLYVRTIYNFSNEYQNKRLKSTILLQIQLKCFFDMHDEIELDCLQDRSDKWIWKLYEDYIYSYHPLVKSSKKEAADFEVLSATTTLLKVLT